MAMMTAHHAHAFGMDAMVARGAFSGKRYSHQNCG
jgi:hypothetical protein